jgi:methylmalonyl-CoA mutase C-terminal domain/subunit
VVVVGGVIPNKDIPILKELGVDGVFPGGTPFDEIVNFIKQSVK